MLFNSLTFFAFMAVVLVLHNLPLPWWVRKTVLLAASYLFYAAWKPPFVLLLILATVVDWWVAGRLMRAESRAARRGLLLVSLGTNLGILGFFKYGKFLTENFTRLLAACGVELQPLLPDIVLPVGISFYTFQTLSYTLDVYLGRSGTAKSLLDYALYVAFFPQLVAGPILRSGDFLPQCYSPRRASGQQLGWGLALLVFGIFEKSVLADALLAPVSELVFDSRARPDALAAWAGTLAFAGQIFCDFAGYSSCAVGAALCLGFAVPDNFKFPYAAVGFSDFWRRWHISFSSWLRDYLYIPLGGNRKGRGRTLVNLAVTMFLGGLWHGASWTFVAWGLLHGVYLAGERLVRGVVPPWRLWDRRVVRAALALVTFGFVCIGWVFFRARSFERAFTVLGSMFGLTGGGPGLALSGFMVATALGLQALILPCHWALRDSSLEALVARCPWWLRAAGIAFMVVATATTWGNDRAFIYFQF